MSDLDPIPNRAEHQRDLEDAETLRQLGRDVPGLGSAIPNREAEDFYDVECRLRRNEPDSLDRDATRNRGAECEHDWSIGYDVANGQVTTARICKKCRALVVETKAPPDA